MQKSCDFLVIGTGLAGLSYALKVADFGKVILISKTEVQQSNTWKAQGGIAAVSSATDSFESHINDTLIAGAGLCKENIVKFAVHQAPERIGDLINWGVKFDHGAQSSEPDLGREGGHSHRRILHVGDHTGRSIHEQLLLAVRNHPNITVLEKHFAVDLITSQKIQPSAITPNECIGAYIFSEASQKVLAVLARFTVLATGGAGRVYLYTSNWDGATGDGIAMAYRAGARVANLEFMQFHPTCLYHPSARNFLISEALRGEGAELIDAKGKPFMKKYHALGSLAPRDIVARSIDAEMKFSAADSVYLDITHRDKDFIRSHFPEIYEKCLSLGIDITKQPIPVVPAAHYLCGGVLCDEMGRTDLSRLLVVGETACTGLHGANRLASNSLLECLVFSHSAATYTRKFFKDFPLSPLTPPDWISTQNSDHDEMVVISHMWDEIRRLMWNYVGIVRSDKRLQRAEHRLKNLLQEVREYYWNFKIHPDILELRNIALVAHLTVECALARKESRGIHFNINYPENSQSPGVDTIL